jgi:hypothetical protein
MSDLSLVVKGRRRVSDKLIVKTIRKPEAAKYIANQVYQHNGKSFK